LDVEKCQSSKHQTIIELTKTVDTNDKMRRVVVETDMHAIVKTVANFTVNINNTLISLVLLLVLDWMGLVHELGTSDLKYAKEKNVNCVFCGEKIRVFRGNWWLDLLK
jgi:hypothetical protein